MDELHLLHRFFYPLLTLLLQHWWVLPSHAPFVRELLCREVGAGLGPGPRCHSHLAVLASEAWLGTAGRMPWAAGRAAHALGNTKGQRFSSCNTCDRFLASERLENVSCLSPSPPPKPAGAACCLTPLYALGGPGLPWWGGHTPVQLGAGAEGMLSFLPTPQKMQSLPFPTWE